MNRTRQQIPHPHQIVRRRREGEDPAHLLDSAVPHVAHQRYRLQPPEALFDPLPLPLADRVAFVPRRAAVNRTAVAARFREKAAADGAKPDAWVFHQKRDHDKPLWDSGVRDALHQAAAAEGCDFPGLGPHSFRRANITWRQEVGGSAIEASKIAGHADLEMTGEYTFVAPERQNELTRRIQAKLAGAAKSDGRVDAVKSRMPTPPVSSPPESPSSLPDAALVTLLVQ
jgi:integrase